MMDVRCTCPGRRLCGGRQQLAEHWGDPKPLSCRGDAAHCGTLFGPGWEYSAHEIIYETI